MRYPVLRRLCLLVIILSASFSNAQGQPQKDVAAAPPATKLEAFSAKTGVVLIRGFSTIGRINGLGQITVEAREFRDGGNPNMRVTGLAFDVKESGQLERDNISFVDYDELESLLKGIEYISKVDRKVTSMEEFEAEYKTKGDFAVMTLSTSEGLRLAISSGKFGKVSAYFNFDDLPKLKQLIEEGKAKLDSTAQNSKH
jgi:hypothetical protein